jgi:hypothetical protein
MRNKKSDFLRKARLCLFLLLGLGLLSCSVLKQENESGASLTAYRISGDLLPGYNENGLLEVLNGVAIINVDQRPYTSAFKELPEQFILRVRVNNETALQRVLARLQSIGFRIKNTALQN